MDRAETEMSLLVIFGQAGCFIGAIALCVGLVWAFAAGALSGNLGGSILVFEIVALLIVAAPLAFFLVARENE